MASSRSHGRFTGWFTGRNRWITLGSLAMVGVPGALAVAAREVVRKGMTLASQHLEVAEADLEFTGGTYRVKGTDRSVALLDLARKHPATAGVHPLDAGGDMAHTSAFPGGAREAGPSRRALRRRGPRRAHRLGAAANDRQRVPKLVTRTPGVRDYWHPCKS